MLPDFTLALPASLSWQAATLAVLATFALTVMIAKVYEWTYQGLSWSPALIQSFVLASIAACAVILAIGDNLASALGSIGFLAMIRFRTNLRDPRDMAFTFACLGSGVACGLQAYRVALIGGLAFCLGAVLMRICAVGSRGMPDGLLRFLGEPGQPAEALVAVLRQHTRSFALVTMREVAQGRSIDHCYQVTLRKPGGDGERALLQALDQLAGVTGISYMSQQATVEV